MTTLASRALGAGDIDAITAGSVGGLEERDNEGATPSRPVLSWCVRQVWLWPALIVVVLGSYHLTRPQVWRDELATWDAASRTVDQLWQLLRHTDASSGAYYLLMHFWIGVFGDSVAALRMPSLLAMAAAAAVTALCGKRMFSPRAGLIAGLVFAVLPAVSRYAQEARAYALAVCAVAVATWLLLLALERARWIWWICYAVAVAAVGALHLVALAALAGHAVVVAVHWWRERRHQALLWFPAACVVGVAAVAPVAWLGMRQVGNQLFWIAVPDLSAVFTVWPALFGGTLVAGAVIIAAALGCAAGRPALAGVAMAVLPLMLIWIVSQGKVSYWLSRYLLFDVPAWALLAGAGLAALRLPAVVAALVALAVAGIPEQRAARTVGSHSGNLPNPPAVPDVDYAGAAAVIAQGYRPGDGVVPVRGTQRLFMLDIGLRYCLPLDVSPRDVFVGRTAAERGEFFAEDTTDPVGALRGERRLWLVSVGQPTDLLHIVAPDQERVLSTDFRVTRVERPSKNTTIALLERLPRA